MCLRDELAERGWTISEFAEIFGQPSQVVSEMLEAKTPVTRDMARIVGGARHIGGTMAQLRDRRRDASAASERGSAGADARRPTFTVRREPCRQIDGLIPTGIWLTT